MKKKLLKMFMNALYIVAVVSASTPSQMGLYEPKIPEKLRK